LVSLATRQYPFLSGCASFANSRPIRSLAGNAGGTAWARLDCGAQILVPMKDYVGRAAFFVGDLDRKISQVIRRIVRPGDQVLDIGANLGVVTLLVSKLVGTSGVVHAFEPNPSIAGMLTQSVERNRLANVKIHQLALGSSDATATLNFPTDNAGMGTLTQSALGSQVVVPVRTLDSIAANTTLDRVRLLKIDVEGFELPVLLGAARVLALTECVQVEAWDRMSLRYGNRLQDTLDLLRASGFSIFRLNAAHTLFATVTSDASGEQGDIYVCVRDPALLTARTGIATEAP
jgi:FkbM family methyltransferase